MIGFTKKQSQMLDFVTNFCDKHDRRPTYKEMGDKFKISKSTAFEIYKRAIDKTDKCPFCNK